MTLWELACCVDGHNEFHGGETKATPPTDEEFEEAKRAHGDA